MPFFDACDRLDSALSRVVRSKRIVSLPVLTARLFDCFADAHIGPATADIAGHGVVDIGIARVRVARQQRRSGHDLPRLAVAALDDLAIEPGLLDFGARRRRANGLDGRDVRIADAVDRSDTGAGGDAVDMHSARAAQGQAAAKLRAGHAEHIAQHPQEWGVAVDIDTVRVPVHFEGNDHGVLSLWVLTASG